MANPTGAPFPGPPDAAALRRPKLTSYSNALISVNFGPAECASTAISAGAARRAARSSHHRRSRRRAAGLTLFAASMITMLETDCICVLAEVLLVIRTIDDVGPDTFRPGLSVAHWHLPVPSLMNTFKNRGLSYPSPAEREKVVQEDSFCNNTFLCADVPLLQYGAKSCFVSLHQA